jgi:uncharacterized protein YraI
MAEPAGPQIGRQRGLRGVAALAVAAVTLLWSAVVSAYPAVADRAVNLRAGPDASFPLVATLEQGTVVEVIGCESDYRWCDVETDGLRGWVYAAFLTVSYDNAPAPLIDYGWTIGLPVVPFIIGSYWGSYYWNRPWYDRYYDWNQWHYRPRPPISGFPPRPPGAFPPAPHPPGAAPHPPQRPPGAFPPAPHPPGAAPHPPQRPPGAFPPEPRPPGSAPPKPHPPGALPPGQRPPGSVAPPARPPGGQPPGQHPPGALPAPHPPGPPATRPPGGAPQQPPQQGNPGPRP